MEAKEIIAIWQKHGVEVLPHFTEIEICREIAEISFKAGIKEVIDSFYLALAYSNPNTRRTQMEAVLKDWQTKLKELGVEDEQR